MKKTLDNSEEFLITTFGNPYDPFTEPDEWRNFDWNNGFNTWSYVCRLADLTPDMSQVEQKECYNNAMLEILRNDPRYFKVTKSPDNKERLRSLAESLLKSLD